LKSFSIHKIEYGVGGLVVLSLIVGLYYFFGLGIERFEQEYVVEDGIVEYGTALFLLFIGIYNFIKFGRHRKSQNLYWMIGTLGLGLLFIFGAGEEISWGQRLLGFETPDTLKEINRQDELNLHNIRIGDFDVNKLIFSKLLTIILIVYFVIFPLLFKRLNWVKSLTNAFGVPVPQIHHTILFLIATLLVLVIPSGKNAELHEFAFAAVFFIIFLFPVNKGEIH
jgi:hypothetical protein